jgi:hypothetical protein
MSDDPMYTLDHEPRNVHEEKSHDDTSVHENKRDSQVPIFQDDDDSVSQSIRSDIKSTVPKINEEDDCSLFSITFGPDTEQTITKTWTTFDDGPSEQTTPKHRHRHSYQQQPSSEHAFQDNFVGHNSLEWIEQEEAKQPSSLQEEIPVRKNSTDSSSMSRVQCSRFSHRHHDAGQLCRGHSLEAPTPEVVVEPTYTDWWPPSAEGAPTNKKTLVSDRPTSVPTKKPIVTGTGNEAYTATPDHKSKTEAPSSEEGVWGPPSNSSSLNNNVFGEPLETNARFKVFSRVVPTSNPNNGFDRAITPCSNGGNDPVSDTDSGIIPKSDSVNIFSIKDDPFDDDFFQ